MFGFLLLAFVALPIVELYFLFQVGDIIGALNTFVLVILIGIIGASFARTQGQMVWLQFQTNLMKGQMPQDSLLHGLMVFIGGVLLITPGFVTDFIGLAFVIPGPRHLLVRKFKKSLQTKMKQGQVRVFQYGNFGGGGGFNYTKMDEGEMREERDAKVVDIIPEKTEHSGPNN